MIRGGLTGLFEQIFLSIDTAYMLLREISEKKVNEAVITGQLQLNIHELLEHDKRTGD